MPLPSLLLLLAACDRDPDSPLPSADDADIFVDSPGDPVPWLDADTLDQFTAGRDQMNRSWGVDEGLGPTFNADSCQGCHQFPGPGGSSPRYRDLWLVKAERWDGAMVDAGTNGESPVKNLYATVPDFHLSVPEDVALFARRNAPPGFGVGLFAFVPDSEILKRVDEDDADGDGISGRANYEQGQLGRFGFKAQAATLESFNRGAFFNQMGITSDPIFHEFPETPIDAPTGALFDRILGVGQLLIAEAWAQVSAPNEPVTDDDDAPDPEITEQEQRELLVFSTYLGVPRPDMEPSETAQLGAEHFTDIGCADCHTPRLESSIGALPAFTDLLLHDMGEGLDDGIGAGLAKTSEFRTQPLWGVSLHGPWLHDGRADSLEEAVEWHGGEAEASVQAWLELDDTGRDALIEFLDCLGGSPTEGQVLTYAEAGVPGVGEAGGPDEALSDEELSLWAEGRRIFDRSAVEAEGLGTHFNADSCRACHQDPVLGGAGGIDTNVIRIGGRDDAGDFVALDSPVVPRSVLWGHEPYRASDEATIVELRQPPTALGVGQLEAIDEALILALEDPDDLDEDGISGRARVLGDGRLGRFGWKAQIPSVLDFVADATLNELGQTFDPALSDFTGTDDDAVGDPELPESELEAVTFYLTHLAPPVPRPAQDADAAERGEARFTDLGCASCHVPELGGVPAFTDLLLHDVAADPSTLVDQEEGLSPGEFRTPPLWGLVDTAPYLHDGSAPDLEAAVDLGHYGEASASREAFLALSDAEIADLVAFLEGI